MPKRVLVLALLILNFSLTLPIGSGHAFSPHRRWETMRYASRDGNGEYSRAEMVDTIAAAVAHYPVDGGFGTVVYIAERESHLHPNAVNTSSGACGLYQHIPRFWPARVAAWRAAHPFMRVLSSCFNARTNIVVSVWWMHVYGLGPWK